MPTPTHLVLIGSMGAGKTTVGRLVARALGRPLVDSDRVLAGEGPNAAEIARARGVDELHDRECRQLRQALADPRPAVVAAAASTIESAACRAALAGHVVVWLRIDPAVSAARVTAAHRAAAHGSDRADDRGDPAGGGDDVVEPAGARSAAAHGSDRADDRGDPAGGGDDVVEPAGGERGDGRDAAPGGDHRRDLGADPVGSLRALAERRDPLYRAAAAVVVDAGALPADEAARRIVAAVRDGAGGPAGTPG